MPSLKVIFNMQYNSIILVWNMDMYFANTRLNVIVNVCSVWICVCVFVCLSVCVCVCVCVCMQAFNWPVYGHCH